VVDIEAVADDVVEHFVAIGPQALEELADRPFPVAPELELLRSGPDRRDAIGRKRHGEHRNPRGKEREGPRGVEVAPPLHSGEGHEESGEHKGNEKPVVEQIAQLLVDRLSGVAQRLVFQGRLGFSHSSSDLGLAGPT
jgi:hypothetical protein